MATARHARDAVRSIAQLLVVVGGGVLIGALLVLLAFPDAVPMGPPVLLGGAGALTVATALAARRLGRPPAPPARRTPPARRKPAAKRTPAANKAAKKKTPAKTKTPAKKKTPAKRKAAQGRSRR